jgi:hypothetical protein
MQATSETLRIHELTKLDAHELMQQFGNSIALEQEALTTDKAGEPATMVAVMTLGALAIRGISLWLMKRRALGEVTFTFERIGPDKSVVERQTARVVFDTSDAPEATVIEKVGAALKVDQGLIDEAKALVKH